MARISEIGGVDDQALSLHGALQHGGMTVVLSKDERVPLRQAQGTCAGGRVMSGMTSVVIVDVAGAPAKTR
jgi:hypothetical protein